VHHTGQVLIISLFYSDSVLTVTVLGADGVSFVESLPRLFAVGKTGLVVVTVQGAPGVYCLPVLRRQDITCYEAAQDKRW